MQPTYTRARRILWRRTSSGVLVLPVSGSETVALRGTGVDVWELVAEPHTASALAQRLAEKYDAPQAAVMAELAPVLDDLSDRGVLARTDRP